MPLHFDAGVHEVLLDVRDAEDVHEAAGDKLVEGGLVVDVAGAVLVAELVERRVDARALAGFRAGARNAARLGVLVPGKVAQVLPCLCHVICAHVCSKI